MLVIKPKKIAMSEIFRAPGVTSLQHTFCIQYPVQFQEKPEIQALINFCDEINAMTPTYAVILDFSFPEINIRAQKIVGLTLIT